MKQSVYALFIILIMLSVGSSTIHHVKVDTRLLDEFDKLESIKQKASAQSIEGNKVNVVIKYSDLTSEYSKQLIENTVDKKRRLDYTNGFSARINKNDLTKLETSPFVDSINFDPSVHIFLNESAPLANSTRVNNLTINGININGTGETVCVIDTGINYTNPNLGGCLGDGCKIISGYDFVNVDADPMDDHSHGTHVAGIVASMNDTYKGISPGANLIAIKALDATGTGSFSDIDSGIFWCVNNATKYNISVISMSIGTTTVYTTNCDSEYTNTATAINNATDHNISVIVASGNSGSITGISSPACITNATSVGSTTKSDAVSSFTNANSLLKLLAPGSSIVSTGLTGGVTTKSGTSMATPHVAGAFALLHEYKLLENGTNLTVAQIFNALNTTGKLINDSGGTDMIFPRINILAAIISLDVVKPIISSILPSNNSVFYTNNISLNYSVSDNVQLDKCWYTNVTGSNQSLANCQNITFLATSDSINNIIFYVNDSNGNVNLSQIFFTVSDILNVSISEPRNITYSINTSLDLNFTALGIIDKIWYKLDNAVNVTIISNSTFNVSEGSHIIVLSVNDSTSRVNQTNVSFYVDITYPNVTIDNPLNTSYNITSINVNYTASDNNALSSCRLEWFNQSNSGINISLSSCQNTTLNNLSQGYQSLKLFVNDTAGNVNQTNLTFFIDLSPPSILIQSPTNTTIFSTNISLNFTVGDNNVVDNCWYLFNSSISNLTSCHNTTFLSDLGSKNITIYANDTTGNINSTVVFFTVPTNAITLMSPENRSYNFNTSLDINFTIRSDFIIDKIWYMLDSNANISINGNSTFNVSEGSHIITLAANDTSGATNKANITFFVDVTNPNITIQTQNKTYNVSFLSINYTVADNFFIDSCRLEWYNQSGNSINTSLSSCQNTTLVNLSSGFHRIRLTVNDSVSNINSTELNFSIDLIAPILNISSPMNLSYQTTNISLNLTVSDFDQCWFLLNTNRTNLTSCQNTTFIAGLGESNLTLYVNDSAGNVNLSAITIFVDQTNPTINVSSPTATTYTSTSISLNFIASDNHQIDRCWYKLNSDANTTSASCANATITASSGSNLLFVAVNDTAGNRNETNITFTVTLPTASTSSGGGGGSSGVSIASTKTKDTFTLTQNTNYASSVLTPVSRIEVNGYTGNGILSVSTPLNIENPIEKSVYSYMNISFTESISSAKIQFYVNKSWIDKNNFDSNNVTLSHYKNKWVDLTTTKIAENATSFTYSSITDSFSLFAITSSPKEIPVVNVSVPETNVTKNTTINNATKINNETIREIQKEDNSWPFILLGIVLVIILAVIIRHYMKKY